MCVGGRGGRGEGGGRPGGKMVILKKEGMDTSADYSGRGKITVRSARISDSYYIFSKLHMAGRAARHGKSGREGGMAGSVRFGWLGDNQSAGINCSSHMPKSEIRKTETNEV